MDNIKELINTFDFDKVVKILKCLNIKNDNEYYTESDLIKDINGLYSIVVDLYTKDNESHIIMTNYGLELSIVKCDFLDYDFSNDIVTEIIKSGIKFNIKYIPVWECIDIELPELDINDININ